jgi:hypothetical protein
MNQTSTQTFMKMLPKVSFKLWPSIRHDCLRYTMQSNNFYNIFLSILRWSKCYLDWQKVSWFGKVIYNHPNRIISLRRGEKTGDEIHTYIISFPIWYRQRLQQTHKSHVKSFHPTTRVITSNLLLHLCPPITRSQFLIYFATSRMDRQLRMMSFIHQLVLELSVFWYNQTVLKP